MAVMKAYQREYINKLVTPNRKEYALTLKNIGTIDQDTILEEAADHSRLDVDTLRHALNALTNTAVLYLKVGHGVQFGNFGSLQPSINVKAVTNREDCNVKTMIGGVKINMQPTGAFAKAIADMKVQLVNVSAAEKSEGGDDNSNVAPADPDPSGTGGNAGNQNQGSQQTQEDVTYTFKYHDNTEDSRSGQPGETVNAPSADSGYHWNKTVPSVFGSTNQTFTEVKDAASATPTETPTDPTKVLLLFNDGAHNNEIVKRMEVEPGYQLQASDLPDGYVYAFKSDDQTDIDAASAGEAVWVTLSPR